MLSLIATGTPSERAGRAYRRALVDAPRPACARRRRRARAKMLSPSRPASTSRARVESPSSTRVAAVDAARRRSSRAHGGAAARGHASSGDSCVERRGTRRKPSRTLGRECVERARERNRRARVRAHGQSRGADADRLLDAVVSTCDSTSMWPRMVFSSATSAAARSSVRPRRASVAMCRTSSMVTRHYSMSRSRLACATTSVLRPIVSSSKSIFALRSRPAPASSAMTPDAELAMLHARADGDRRRRPATPPRRRS